MHDVPVILAEESKQVRHEFDEQVLQPTPQVPQVLEFTS
jgi:hypothetical protein